MSYARKRCGVHMTSRRYEQQFCCWCEVKHLPPYKLLLLPTSIVQLSYTGRRLGQSERWQRRTDSMLQGTITTQVTVFLCELGRAGVCRGGYEDDVGASTIGDVRDAWVWKLNKIPCSECAII